MIFKHKIILLFFVLFVENTSFASIFDELKITSESLVIEKENNQAIFENNVTIFFKDLKLVTEKLVIYYNFVDNKQEVVKAVIPNKLKAIKNCSTEIVIADSAIFDNKTKTLTLEGNVILEKEGNILITDKLIYSTSLQNKEKDNAT